MLMEQTVEKLVEMRLVAMAAGLREQLAQGDASELCFEDRFGLLVDREWTARQERRWKRRVQEARLKQNACVEDIDYRHPRGLDRRLMQELITCRWVVARRNLILTGPTGVGKTWLACALAEKVCREGRSARYTRVPRLVAELAFARADGTYLKTLEKLARVDLLVLDDWALCRLEGQAQHDLLEVVDDRVGSRSTLVTSQYPVSQWHDTLGDPSVADALLDRLVGGAIQVDLKGESKRKGSDS